VHSHCFTFEYSPSYTTLVMYSKFHMSACFYYLGIVFVVYPVLFMWQLLILHAVYFPYLPTTTTGKSQGRTLPSVQQLRYYRNSKHPTACRDPLLVYEFPIRQETAELWNIWSARCRWRWQVRVKRWFLAAVPHDVTSVKITLLAITFRAERVDQLAWSGELDT
jgi:hypothetical protein